MKKCKSCGEEFEKGCGQCCSRSCHSTYINSCRNYKDPSYKANLQNAKIDVNNARYGNLVIITRNCLTCNSEFTIRHRAKNIIPTKKFCSKLCSNTNPQLKLARAATLKDISKNDPNWGFKDKELHKKAEEASMLNPKNDRRMSSKAERAIRTVLQENQEGWAAHRIIEHKAVDCMNKGMQIIFEYDGPTHFREIYGNFEVQKQKDANVEQWVKDNGWQMYRISDHYHRFMFNSDPQKVYDDIQEFLKSNEQVIHRYTGKEETW